MTNTLPWNRSSSFHNQSRERERELRKFFPLKSLSRFECKEVFEEAIGRGWMGTGDEDEKPVEGNRI